MTDKKEINSDEISPGVMAIIELTATKAAKAVLKEYECNIANSAPRDKCENCMTIIAQREVKNHINDCPFKRIMWMCLGGSSVLSVVCSLLFQAAKLKWFP